MSDEEILQNMERLIVTIEETKRLIKNQNDSIDKKTQFILNEIEKKQNIIDKFADSLFLKIAEKFDSLNKANEILKKNVDIANSLVAKLSSGANYQSVDFFKKRHTLKTWIEKINNYKELKLKKSTYKGNYYSMIHSKTSRKVVLYNYRNDEYVSQKEVLLSDSTLYQIMTI